MYRSNLNVNVLVLVKCNLCDLLYCLLRLCILSLWLIKPYLISFSGNLITSYGGWKNKESWL